MKRITILLLFVAAAALFAPQVGAQLAQQSYAELQQQYDALHRQAMACQDAACCQTVNTKIAPVTAEMWRRNLGALRANDAAFTALTSDLDTAAKQLHAASVNKWCHSSPWRRLRRYQQPQWCPLR